MPPTCTTTARTSHQPVDSDVSHVAVQPADDGTVGRVRAGPCPAAPAGDTAKSSPATPLRRWTSATSGTRPETAAPPAGAVTVDWSRANTPARARLRASGVSNRLSRCVRANRSSGRTQDGAQPPSVA